MGSDAALKIRSPRRIVEGCVELRDTFAAKLLRNPWPTLVPSAIVPQLEVRAVESERAINLLPKNPEGCLWIQVKKRETNL